MKRGHVRSCSSPNDHRWSPSCQHEDSCSHASTTPTKTLSKRSHTLRSCSNDLFEERISLVSLGRIRGKGSTLKGKLAVGAVVAALVAVPAVPAGAAGDVVVDNLASPLGFDTDAYGNVYVAEAFAGQLTKVEPDNDRTELASAPPGSGTAGVAVTKNGSVYYTLSLPPEQGGAPETALGIVRPDGSTDTLASLSDYEARNNPDQVNVYGVRKRTECFRDLTNLERFVGPARFRGIVESNPYAVADEGYGSAIVADAAGNDILRVVNGNVSTVAVLPPVMQKLTKPTLRSEVRRINRKLERRGKDPIPRDSLDSCIGQKYASNPVPTDVEIGPDGNYYVSGLPGFPENPGEGKVWRINAATGAVKQIAKGFTSSTGLAVRDNGTIFVAELFVGQVSKVRPGDTVPSSSVQVPCAAAVEISRHTGKVLVSQAGICGPDPGQIVELH